MKTLNLVLMIAFLTVLFISQSVQAVKTNLHKKSGCKAKGERCSQHSDCCGVFKCRKAQDNGPNTCGK